MKPEQLAKSLIFRAAQLARVGWCRPRWVMDGAACWTNSLGQLTAEVMAHDHGLVQLELRFIADEDDGDPWDFLEVFQLTTDGGRPSGKLVRLLRKWGHIGLDPRTRGRACD